MNRRALPGLALALTLAAGAAQADLLRHCAPPPPLDAVQHDRLFRFAALVRETLDQSGQRLALIARAGTDLRRFGQRYSHAGIALLASPNTPWSVRQLYYDCDASQPRLFDQGLPGFLLGGDKRHGLRTSAAVIVADPRPGMSRRTDGQTANINVCEHPDPVGELRRIYDAASQTLGYRTLEQFSGGDVYQLKVMLNALGLYKKGETLSARMPEANLFTAETVAAVDAFRTSEKMGTPSVGGSPAGLVDRETVARLWSALERAGKATAVRQMLLDITMVRR